MFVLDKNMGSTTGISTIPQQPSDRYNRQRPYTISPLWRSCSRKTMSDDITSGDHAILQGKGR